MIRAAAICVLLALASGCVVKRTPAWNAPGQPFGTISDAIVGDLIADGDHAWQRRSERGELAEASRAYRAALRYRPDDPNLLLRLAGVALYRGKTQRGSGAAGDFDEATRNAERALAARNPKLAAAARAGAPPSLVFSHAEPADAPALGLYAEALLDWAKGHGTATVLRNQSWIRAAALRALAFDPSVAFAAPNRVLGILECALPEAKQNLQEALERFEAAIAAAPAYLPTRLGYAEEYATRTRDAALYRRLLAEVVAADAAALPEAAPENRDAQKTARELLHRAR